MATIHRLDGFCQEGVSTVFAGIRYLLLAFSHRMFVNI